MQATLTETLARLAELAIEAREAIERGEFVAADALLAEIKRMTEAL